MSTSLPSTEWSHHVLHWGQQTHVMGILNVTPDSFSGDGLVSDFSPDITIARTVEQALTFVAAGVSILDVGGESTRPAFQSISAQDEIARVVPVIRALRAALPAEVLISIDTYKAEVASQALQAGASLVNDIWALRHDPAMASVVAQAGVPVVLMANLRGSEIRDVFSDVLRFLAGQIDVALRAGIAWEHLIIDPGIGFGMGFEGDLTLLRRLGELRGLGRPLLVGTSRKSIIGKVLGGIPASERLEGTAATVALAIAQGVDIVRVHDVEPIMRVVKMSDAIVRGTFTL